MMKRNASMRVAGAGLLCLTLCLPATAVMRQGDAGVRGTNPAGGSAAAVPGVNREGFVLSLNVAAQTIVINNIRYIIGAPQLALLDKRPKSDGLLTLAGVQVGSFVRYRTEKTPAGERVVELWLMRDPQQALGTRP